MKNDLSELLNRDIPQHVKDAILSLPTDIAENLVAVYDDDTNEFLFVGIRSGNKVVQLANAEYVDIIDIVEEQIRKELDAMRYYAYHGAHSNVTIIDEASMIDFPSMDDIADYLRKEMKKILYGDES